MLRLIINYFIARSLFGFGAENKAADELHNKVIIGDRVYELPFLRQKVADWLGRSEKSIHYNQESRSFFVSGTSEKYRVDDILPDILERTTGNK